MKSYLSFMYTYYMCVQISNLTDEQIDSILSAAAIRPAGGGGGVEPIKSDGNTVAAKTPLELQVNALCSKIRNPKQPPSSENWVETIFENVESLLGKDKVFCLKTTDMRNTVYAIQIHTKKNVTWPRGRGMKSLNEYMNFTQGR